MSEILSVREKADIIPVTVDASKVGSCCRTGWCELCKGYRTMKEKYVLQWYTLVPEFTATASQLFPGV